MPISKNTRKRPVMKPKKFWTAKSARKYLKKFAWRFAASARHNKKLTNSYLEAFWLATKSKGV